MELSEEEKKAIKELKHYINITPYWKQEEYTNSQIDNYIKILLSLIERQQKEIEELISKYKDLFFQNFELWEKSIFPKQTIEKDYISKDKIRERIKHNEEQINNVVRVAKFKINDDGITGEGIEGLNDLIVYKSYEAVINELNYLLEE